MPLFGPPDVEKMKIDKDAKGLIKALRYKKDENVRKRAVDALGQFDDALNVEPLIAALKDGSEAVRKAAVKSLGQIADPRAVEPLIDILDHGSEPVREAGLQVTLEKGISELNSWEREQALVFAIKDIDRSVRKAAALALGEIGDPRAVDPLGDTFINRDVSDVREAAAIALGKIGAPCRSKISAWTSLLNAIEDESNHVRIATAKALGKIGGPDAAKSLIAALEDNDDDVRNAAAGSLEQLGWEPDIK